MTHSDLCALAVRWLKRSFSAGGHGCQLAVSECATGFGGEIPDAIGFRANWRAGSVVVECKVSRADFLADKAKPHRAEGVGVGTWRYFMAPAGLLTVAELPTKWGLVEVSERGHTKVVHGAMSSHRQLDHGEHLDAFRCQTDFDRERNLLVMLFGRISDPELVSLRLREANNSVARLAKALDRERSRKRSEPWSRVANDTSPALSGERGEGYVGD